MKKHSLSTNGLSLSQAQSISNLCFQRAQDISAKLDNLNNATKSLKIGTETYIETQGKQIPENVVELLREKAELHATQAFLMENIKVKDYLIRIEKSKPFSTTTTIPERPTLIVTHLLDVVTEDFGWEQLSVSEYNEYLEAESYAAHIGQFIHKNCPLDNLRRELLTIKTLEWITIKDGEKTPLKVDVHHTPEQLLTIHEELAALHRQYEQRVNYFKAKVKNLTTEENARIARVNAEAQAEANAKNSVLIKRFQEAYDEYERTLLEEKQRFEATRQDNIKKLVALKIEVDKRFQPVVNTFLQQLK